MGSLSQLSFRSNVCGDRSSTATWFKSLAPDEGENNEGGGVDICPLNSVNKNQLNCTGTLAPRETSAASHYLGGVRGIEWALHPETGMRYGLLGESEQEVRV